MKVWMAKQITYEVSHGNKIIIAPSLIDLVLSDNQSLSLNASIKSSSVKKVAEQIVSPVPEKRRIMIPLKLFIKSVYKELI